MSIYPELDLEPEILVSTLRGEDPRECTADLDRVLTVARARMRYLAEQGARRWEGEKTVVIIAPSSEVLDWGSGGAENLAIVEVLARVGRSAGVSLRLLDANPQVPQTTVDGETRRVGSLTSFGGSSLLRAHVGDEGVQTVSFHPLSPSEMADLAETYSA
jgi:hypothetical protein